jgi:hypothetical protein
MSSDCSLKPQHLAELGNKALVQKRHRLCVQPAWISHLSEGSLAGRFLVYRMGITHPHKTLYVNAYYGVIHDSPEWRLQISINWWIDEQNVLKQYNELLFKNIFKKEIGSCYVTQAGSELLDSSNPPASHSEAIKRNGGAGVWLKG